jgi:hypothetical protein
MPVRSKFLWVMSVVFVAIGARASFAATSEKPSGAEIKAALERGKILRDLKELIPAALGKNAFVITINGVRCGHGITTLEDAKGEGGAVYRLIEESRSATADESGGIIVDYKGTYLLNGGLGLISGSLRWKENVRKFKEDKQQTHEDTCELRVDHDELKWDATLGGNPSKDSTPLHGDTPIPQSLLTTLVALAGRTADGFGKAFCVPELSPRTDQDSFDIQPAWITFERVKDKPNATLARVLHLVGVPAKKEMEGLPAAVWTAAQVWMLEGTAITSYPAPAAGIDVDAVPPEKLDPDAPLDLSKIAQSQKP